MRLFFFISSCARFVAGVHNNTVLEWVFLSLAINARGWLVTTCKFVRKWEELLVKLLDRPPTHLHWRYIEGVSFALVWPSWSVFLMPLSVRNSRLLSLIQIKGRGASSRWNAEFTHKHQSLLSTPLPLKKYICFYFSLLAAVFCWSVAFHRREMTRFPRERRSIDNLN